MNFQHVTDIALLCRQVVGVDVDEDALALAQENCEELEVIFLSGSFFDP